MAYSTLKTKTPLKAKKSLSNKGSSLKAKKSLRDSYAEKMRSGEQQPKKSTSTSLKPRKSMRDSYAEKVLSGEKQLEKSTSASLKPQKSMRDAYAEKVLSGEKQPKNSTSTSLKPRKSMRDAYAEKVLSGEKQAYKPPKPGIDTAKKEVKPRKPKETKHTSATGAYKPSYPYESILTPTLDTCYITGSHNNIHIHHIFGASNKANSEKYHFLVPLRNDWHNGASYGVHFDHNLDLKLKRKCQEYWLKHYGTKEEFIKVFGKWW